MEQAMGILDELDIKVEEIRAEQLRRDLELEAQQKYYLEELRPLMLQAQQYLYDIVQKLNMVSPEIKPSYPLNPLSKQPISFNQTDYQIESDSQTSPHQIDIFCNCTLEETHEFFVPTRDAASRYAELLHTYNFYHHRKDSLDGHFEVRGGTFFLEGPMHVRIRIVANAEERCIQIILRNLEESPVKQYKFSPDKFTPALLQRLARLLVREETTLVEVALSGDYRERLRRQLEEERRKKEEDLEKAFAEQEMQRIEEENARFRNRAKRAAIDFVARSSSYLSQYRDKSMRFVTNLTERISRK